MKKLTLFLMGFFLLLLTPMQESYSGEIQYIPDIEISVDINKDIVPFEATASNDYEVFFLDMLVENDISPPLDYYSGNKYIYDSITLNLDYNQLGYSMAQ